ncbi:KinB-signaling pathway activation protein [Bacillus testis]|uniref:KinB-signaling pathway activation protein n=1 Tax=Bacillus testis TaxID=1622072 RepID=UPI00067EA33C|nr:KinB-signaling pathway activation protein [Bacillus testis]
MSSRNLVRLFLSTLLLGGLSTGVVGFIVKWGEYHDIFVSGKIPEIIAAFIWFIGVGMIFSVISQMGFFAYLTVHRFGLGMFRSLWSPVQVILILLVLFDLIYFRFLSFGKNNSVAPYVVLGILLFIAGLIVAYIKMKQTNRHAFIPALFFMTVVTVIEMVPVLRVKEDDWLFFMSIPLVICNAYQMLALHKINQRSEKELEEKRKNNKNTIKGKVQKA